MPPQLNVGHRDTNNSLAMNSHEKYHGKGNAMIKTVGQPQRHSATAETGFKSEKQSTH
jgi:hypothetical protein